MFFQEALTSPTFNASASYMTPAVMSTYCFNTLALALELLYLSSVKLNEMNETVSCSFLVVASLERCGPCGQADVHALDSSSAGDLLYDLGSLS